MKILGLSAAAVILAGLLPAAAADTRLIDAVKSGDAKAVRALLAQHAPLNAAEPDGSTALHEAARSGNLEIADLLITAGAPVSAATRYNITPLSLACRNGDAPMIDAPVEGGCRPERHVRSRPNRAHDRRARQGKPTP